MNKRVVGSEGEEKAVRHLLQEGCNIITTNYTCKIGEIDIIAKHDGVIIFIEVKYRKNTKMGRPYEAVHYYKQMKIIKSAMWYAQKNNLFEKAMRFDVIEIIDTEVVWIKNAFTIENNLNLL
ncbi:MAG: YraN family protein [Firmicutes bacterium HGW-Firmicutes-1]|jgi:putative endonuclease|nr:MAG: YraN family protein [Firmicutes bacterium HGW-Firmicutes-1]